MTVRDIEPEELVDIGLYEDEGEVVEEGIRQILRSHPEYKLEIAIERYKREAISMGKAADIAGISLEEMKEILNDRGIGLKGPKSQQEIEEDAQHARKTLQ